jgi:hypothetical protein
VGRREFTTKCRVRVCGRRAVSLRAADQRIEGLLTARSGLVSFARHRAGSSSTNSTVGHLAQRARGSAATISVDCSHVSAHPMPDDMAKLISRACNHAVFAPENVSRGVEQHAQRTRAKVDGIYRRMAPNAAPAPDVEAKVDQATTVTPKIPRRRDAMTAPFTTDQLDARVQPPAAQSLTYHRNRDPSPWPSRLNAKS